MNRILALQEMSTKFNSDVMAGSINSNTCSSESSNNCSALSITCDDNKDGFALEW